MTSPEVPTVTPRQAAERGADVVLIDVREQHEWDAGHADSALHHPLSELDPSRVPDQTLFVVCRSGGRSAAATMALLEAGHDAHNVAGGMSAWEAAGHPVICDGGTVGTVI